MARRGGAERRAQFVATAQQLFYTKGYDNTSINDIIKAVGVSKGAFYHYFDSKQAVLSAIVEGLDAQCKTIVRPILGDTTGGALEKFARIVEALDSWSIEQRDQVLSILRVMHSDENLLLQHKLHAARMERTIPMMTQIIEQGVAEGVFELRGISAENSAEFLLAITNTADQFMIKLLLATDRPANAAALALDKFKAAQQTVEQMLNAPAGSMPIIDDEILMAWFVD